MINVQTVGLICDRISSYSKIVRVLGWILRFVHNSLHSSNKVRGELTGEESKRAEILLIRQIQSQSFQDEKFLKRLQAFKDENHVLRVRTKLTECEENENFRTPILLPANKLVSKLIHEEHCKSMHAGLSTLLARLRERYWILKVRRSAKKIISNCVICKRHKSKAVDVPFAPLPKDRVTQSKVFQVTGIDYAGPLYLRTKGKAWIVIFTCAVYRAVHFELVESLSTEAFMQALRRFITRRGRISTLYSDNGTNFHGANNALASLDWSKITTYTATRRISWKFIPPTAAWWGGFWERMVRMVKELLRRVLGKSCLNYEELNTTLCDCEAVINSRPLTYITSDPNDLIALTPQMFILENSNSEVPDLDTVDRSFLIKRFKYLQKLREDLRQRFKNEYLSLLVHKGIRKSENLQVGDVVLVGSDNQKRINWPLGIVINIFPGKDGIPRVAKLKTAQGERIRPFQRLYPLEISAKSDVSVLRGVSENIKVPPQNELVDNQMPDSVTTTRYGRTVKIPNRLNL